MRQLDLFPATRPMWERFGAEFFRAAPRLPGVYIMSGEAERVLYIGQSKNLRQRLGTYKNARRDRVPRKIIRLAHEVRSIVWETCESSEAARQRELELLKLHRPKFNVANTWPAPQRFFTLGEDGEELVLDCVTEKEALSCANDCRAGSSVEIFGPFKASALQVYGALRRLLWVALRSSSALWDYPAGFCTTKPPRPFRFRNRQPSTNDPPSINSSEIHCALCAFLSRRSDDLILLLKSSISAQSRSCPPFQSALLASDIEVLERFASSLSKM